MIRINASPMRLMTDDTFAGLHKELVEASKLIHMGGFTTISVYYENDLERFKERAKDPRFNSATVNASAARKQRDQALNQFRLCAKLWSQSDDVVKSSLGKAIWKPLVNFTHVDHKSKEQVTDKINQITHLVREYTAKEPSASTFAGSELETDYLELTKAEVTYLKAKNELQDKQSEHDETSSAFLREVCIGHFQRILVTADMMADLKDDKECLQFVHTANMILKKYQAA